MSDRDKKVILILMIIAVVALPYVFVIKEKRVGIEGYKATNAELQARLDYLQSLDAERDNMVEETEDNDKARDAIIASFPADIIQENYVMYLLNTEWSSGFAPEGAPEGEYMRTYPVAIQAIEFNPNVVTPLSEDDDTDGLAFNTISNVSTIGYQMTGGVTQELTEETCSYDTLKYLLDYIKDYNDPITYSHVTAQFDETTGIISGEIMLVQYAVSGEGRTPAPLDMDVELINATIDADVESMDGRGMSEEQDGMFGNVEGADLVNEETDNAGVPFTEEGETEEAVEE